MGLAISALLFTITILWFFHFFPFVQYLLLFVAVDTLMFCQPLYDYLACCLVLVWIFAISAGTLSSMVSLTFCTLLLIPFFSCWIIYSVLYFQWCILYYPYFLICCFDLQPLCSLFLCLHLGSLSADCSVFNCLWFLILMW